ncbi:very short patch repair endonuclease [Rugamonas rivuli]|uniref:very short patch repair endonuclease n=1 Tax=Rugamonas rivuli TaxID=2743358 RepID=UPI00128CC34F
MRKLGQTGYCLHRDDIPGKPDIAWIGKKRAIFINGCFWHGHTCARGPRQPKTRAEYWRTKIQRTQRRDNANKERLASDGWKVLVLWECELKNKALLAERLVSFLA